MNSDRPDEVTLSEEARHFANLYVWAVDTQIKRIKRGMVDPTSLNFALQMVMDFEFLLSALRKLRRSAELMSRIPTVEKDINKAIRNFDEKLPDLQNLRNASEHFDEHLEGRDRGKNLVDSYVAHFSTLKYHENSVEWLQRKLDLDIALTEAHFLFDSVRQATRKVAAESGIKLDFSRLRPTTGDF